MKKILLLLVCVFFVSCATTTVKYVGDIYYPDKGYFEVYGTWLGDAWSSINIDFRTINGTDKVIVIAENTFDNIMTVSDSHKILLKFSDGKELELDYNMKVSQYEHGHFELKATSDVIKDFGTLEIVRMQTDDGYMNFKATKKRAEILTTRFKMIQAESTAEYSKKK